jgi:hypothetical protein
MTDDQCERLILAITKIAHGDVNGPTGLEGLAMALSGQGLSGSIAGSLSEIACAISELAESVDRVASVLRDSAE